MTTNNRIRRKVFSAGLALSATIFFLGFVLFAPLALNSETVGFLTVVTRLLLLVTTTISFILLYSICVKRAHDIGLSSFVLLPFATLGAVSIFAAERGVFGISLMSGLVTAGFVVLLACCPSGRDNAYGPCPVERRSPLRPRGRSNTAWRFHAERRYAQLADLLESLEFNYKLKNRRKDVPH